MTGGGNWTYFLPGRCPVLIDAGVGLDAHLEALAAQLATASAHVVVTHAHADHISGVATIAERWPQTAFSKLAWPERDQAYRVPWQFLADGDVMCAGDGELHVVHTPGHAPDHLALWEPSIRTLFSGDLVVAGSTVVIPASMEGSLRAYLESLERVLALNPARLLPAHGDPIEEPAPLIREYLEHRRARERQIIAGLRAGDRTVAALVARIYVGLDPGLVAMASESVRAHLRKLADEGAAHQVGDEWALY
jgi:glyoxylase-like metal-dependent hydrolase (beta-lactamase superfamily II)